MPSGHSLLYLFGYDVFHQVLFYFGSVAAVVILFWEKFYDKPINWRLAFGAFVFCLFVSTFQAWIDEHANTNNVIQEKASLSSEKSDLAGQLRDKQHEVDYLRDHQLDAFRMGQSSSSQSSRVPADTRSSDIASAMKSNSDLIRSLLPRRSEPAENPLKQRLLVLSQDILKMSQDRARIEPRIELGRLGRDAASSKAAMDEEFEAHRRWDSEMTADYNLRFAGKVQAVLQEAKDNGVIVPQQIFFYCNSYPRVVDCGIGLSTLANRM